MEMQNFRKKQIKILSPFILDKQKIKPYIILTTNFMMLNTRTSPKNSFDRIHCNQIFFSDLEYYFDYYALMNCMVIWKLIT